MNIRAFILIETEPGKAPEVVRNLTTNSGYCKWAYLVTGPWDAIVCVETPSLEELSNWVFNFVHKTDGVTKTITNIAVEES